MSEIRQLADSIYVDRIRRARGTPGPEKLVDGLRLYERAVHWMKEGIRHCYPDAAEDAVHEQLIRQLTRLRRIEEHELYYPYEELK